MRPHLGLPIVLGAAVLAFGCQNESNASFDDSVLPSNAGTSSDAGKGGTDSGGTSAEGGSGADMTGGGDTATGGTGGKTTGGEGGKAMGGTGGKAMGGAGGTSEGGNMMGGAAGTSGGNPQGGMGGMSNPPEPVTIKITEIVDAMVSSCMTNTNYGSDKTLDVDADFNCVHASLLQPTLTAIPAGATVTEATLSLNCVDRGDEVSIYYPNAKWTESMVRWSNRPTVGDKVGTFACTVDGSTVTLDLTEAVAAWLSGGREQSGIYLTTMTSNGVTFDSTEADAFEHRPSLSITYTPAAK